MPEQRATSHGKTATLQRVVVTRSATSVIVRGLPFPKINGDVAQDMPHITIQAPGENDTCNAGSSPFCNLVLPPEGDGTWSFIDPHDFSQAQGTWTLTIQEGLDTWVFHFVVPA